MTSSSQEIGTDEVLPQEFGDTETRRQLELLDDLRRIGVSEHVDLPQLVVVGDQSTGKSSVLQAVTEIPFAVDDKMCNRFATEIVLRRTLDETPPVKISIDPSVEESVERKKLLKDWRPTGFDPSAPLTKAIMKSVFSQAEEVIFGNSTRRNGLGPIGRLSRLSGSILRIEKSGPRESNFTIVDVPGLIRSDETSDDDRTATSLVEQYMRNPRSIIVVVIDVVDLERQGIFSMLDRLPDVENRVIGVINKCDIKQIKSHDWVFDLIRNVDQSTSRKYLKDGWYGLRNRQPREIGISDAERDKLEEAFFKTGEWSSLDPTKLGRHQLRKALIKMLNRHLKKSIPGLLAEILKKLDSCNDRLSELGEPRTTNQAQFMLINRIAMDYSNKVQSGLQGHYNNLSDSQTFIRSRVLDDLDSFQAEMAERGLLKPFRTSEEDGAAIAQNFDDGSWASTLLSTPTYEWIQRAIQEYRSSPDRRKSNPEAEVKLWQEQTASWNEISTDALKRVEETVSKINSALFQEVCYDDDLRLKLTNWLHDDFARASVNAREELQRLLVDERGAQLFSLQPLKSVTQHGLRLERIQNIAQKYILVDPRTAKPLMSELSLEVRPIRVDEVINTLIYQHQDLSTVLDMHDSLAAYYKIALYRFIDNFALQVVERHLLGPAGPLRLFNSDFVTQKLYGEANAAVLSGLAGENPAVAEERATLESKKASLEEGRKRAVLSGLIG